MSISSMANIAADRVINDRRGAGGEGGMLETAAAAQGESSTTGAVTAALDVVMSYVPTEILTLYVAVMAVVQAENQVSLAEWNTFWFFLAATPLVVWLVFAGKLRGAGRALPVAPTKWPWWEIFAATTAFVAWALALPKSPFSVCSWYVGGLAGIVVLVTSTVLGLLSAIFRPQPLA